MGARPTGEGSAGTDLAKTDRTRRPLNLTLSHPPPLLLSRRPKSTIRSAKTEVTTTKGAKTSMPNETAPEKEEPKKPEPAPAPAEEEDFGIDLFG